MKPWPAASCRLTSVMLLLAAAVSGQNQGLETRTPDGGLFVTCDEGLRRVRPGPPVVLRCTEAEGTGRIHDLASHESGLVFAAAERGLFVTHPEVETLDRVPLGDGAPAGVPVGVHSDRVDRLWIATRQSFGCVHVGQWFGRTSGDEAGIRAPPYTSLSADGEGALRLGTESGKECVYRPDRAPPPTVAVLSVGGMPFAGGVMETGTSPEIELQVAGEAAGGPTFRYRMERHHLLRALHDDRIPGLYPHTHRIEIYAFDRDLNRSSPAVIRPRVTYPPQYDRRLLVPVIAAGSLLVLLAFMLWALRRGEPRRRATVRGALGAVLFVVVALQVLAGILGHGRSYPFVGFSMYGEVYEEQSLIFKPEFFGLMEDGRRQRLPASYTAYATDGTWAAVAPLIYGSEQAHREFLERFNAATGARLAGFEVWERRDRLTPRGPERVAPLRLARYFEGDR